MKLIGFIKEHNNIKEAIDYSVFKTGMSHPVSAEIINYLDSGIYIFGWMGVFMDLDNQDIISPDCYYTDGIYVWPAYFSYYLKKHPNTQIDEHFLEHASKNNFRIDESKIDDCLKEELELEFSKRIASVR